MLILCIRFSYFLHADLISLTNEQILEKYKDLILQGLSARLDTYENTNEKKIIINLTPRKYLRRQNILRNNININKNLFKNDKFTEINNEDKSETYPQKIKKFNKFDGQRNYAYSQPINNVKNVNNNDYIKDEAEFHSYDENNEMNNSNQNYLGDEALNIDEINSKKKNFLILPNLPKALSLLKILEFP